MENKKYERREKEINKILNSKAVEYKNEKMSILAICGIIVGLVTAFIITCILIENVFEGNIFNKLIWMLISFVTFIVAFVSAIYSKKVVADKKYKENVMPDIIEKVFENSFYNAEKFIDKELFYESGLFEKAENTYYSGSNYIEYEREKINTVTSNLRVIYSGGKTPIIQFSGEYFINIFEKYDENRKLTIKYREKISKEELNIPLILIVGTILFFLGIIGFSIIIVYLILKIFKYIISHEPDNLRKFSYRYGKEFGDLFIVQGSYLIADKILTEDLIEILLNLKKSKGVKTSISIENNIVYIAFDTGKELFSSGLFDDNKEKYAKDYYIMKEIRKVNDFIADKVLKALG